MNKAEFLDALRERLKNLPYGEVRRITDYYSEYISDACDSGKTEEQVIFELGDINMLINKLKAELSFETAKKQPTLSNGLKALIAVVICIASLPVALPVLIVVFSVVVALFGAIIALGAALIAALVACVAIVIELFTQSFMMFPGNTGMALLMLGGSLLASGLLSLVLIGLVYLARAIVLGLIKLIKSIFRWATNKGRQ